MSGAMQHHVRMEQWLAEDSLVRRWNADESLRCLRDSTVQYVPHGGTIHGAIGKMLAWNYLKVGAEETLSAVHFLWGAQGAPDIAHGGQIASAFDHCFGHCMRAVIGVGPQFTVRLRTEFRRRAPLRRTLCCHVRVVGKEARPGKGGKDGRCKVELRAELLLPGPEGSAGDVVATSECTFVAITDPLGLLSRHAKPFSSQLMKHNEAAERQARENPVVYDDLGRILGPMAELPYFSCRGGAARCFEASRRWVQESAHVAWLSAQPGLQEMDLAYLRCHGGFQLNAGRWCPSDLPAQLLRELEARGEAPAAVSVTDNRVMECYFADRERPRVVGVLRFSEAAAGPPGRTHGGVVASAMDESFVWAGQHLHGGMTAWLDVSLRSAAPLQTDLCVIVQLDRVEGSTTKGRSKVYMSARLFQPRKGAANGSVDDALAAGTLVCEATTLLVSSEDVGLWRSAASSGGAKL